MASDGSVVIGTDIELKEFNKSSKTINDMLEKIAKKGEEIKIEPTTKGVKSAEKELAELSKKIEEQSTVLEEAEADWKSYASYVKNGGAEMEAVAEYYRKPYEAAGAALDDLIAQEAALEDALSSAKKQMQDTGKKTKKLGDDVEETGKKTKKTKKEVELLDAALGILAIVGIQKVITSLTQFIDKSTALRKELSYLEQNAKTYNKEMDELYNTMARMAPVTDNMNERVAATSALLGTKMDENEMEKALDALSGAVVSLPGRYKLDTLAESLQRTVSQGKATEQFAELIQSSYNKTGVSLEEFNKKMENTSSEAGRQRVALQYLAQTGLGDVYKEYLKNNEALVESAENNHEYEMSIAAIGEALQPIKNDLENVRNWFLKIVADNPKVIPALTGIALALGAIATVLTTLVAIKKVKDQLSDLFSFGEKAEKVKGAKKTIEETTESLDNMGKNAKESAQNFLLYAVGVAAVAAAVSVLVISITQLVKAFNQSDESAIVVAAAIAIVMAAITGGLAALTAMYKLVGKNSTEFLLFGAGLVVVASAISLIILAMTGLVNAFNSSDSSAMEMAAALSTVLTTITLSIVIISAMGALMGKTAPQLLMFGAALLVVASAVLVLAAALALLRYAFTGSPIAMNMQTPTAPSINDLQGQAGYARGTVSARRGWNWVGENGPELVNFGGGESVLTKSQSMARQSALTSGGTTVIKNYNISGISIPADNVKSFVDVVNIMEMEAAGLQQGVVD